MPRHARPTARERRSRLKAVPGGRPPAPRPPEGLLAASIETWEAFWVSPLAALVLPVHVPALTHLWYLYDERARCYRQLRQRGRITKGSTGQLVRSPLYDIIRQLTSEIGRLEDRFGLSPGAAERLGVGSDTDRSLADLNSALEAGDNEPSDEFLRSMDGKPG